MKLQRHEEADKVSEYQALLLRALRIGLPGLWLLMNEVRRSAVQALDRG
jgi:hypothetical protein